MSPVFHVASVPCRQRSVSPAFHVAAGFGSDFDRCCRHPLAWQVRNDLNTETGAHWFWSWSEVNLDFDLVTFAKRSRLHSVGLLIFLDHLSGRVPFD